MANTMPQSLELKGICGVCALVDSCERVKDLKEPLMTCEKLEPDPTLVSEMVEQFLESSNPHAVSLNHLGLCSNCDHRVNCTFPKAEGGVWHCEEYA
jgi:hypothetical protein